MRIVVTTLERADRLDRRGAERGEYSKEQQDTEDQPDTKTENPPVRVEKQSHRTVG